MGVEVEVEGVWTLSNQSAGNLLPLAFGKMIVKALWAESYSSPGHPWPPGP